MAPKLTNYFLAFGLAFEAVFLAGALFLAAGLLAAAFFAGAFFLAAGLLAAAFFLGAAFLAGAFFFAVANSLTPFLCFY